MIDSVLPMLSLYQGGIEDPYKRVALEEIRKYLHISVRNIFKTYDE